MAELHLRPRELIRVVSNVLTIHTEDLVFPVYVEIVDGFFTATTASRYVLAKDICNEERADTEQEPMLDIFQYAEPTHVEKLEWAGFVLEEEFESLLEFLKTVKDLKKTPGNVKITETDEGGLLFSDTATGNTATVTLAYGFYGNTSNAESVLQAMLNVTDKLEDTGVKTYAVNPEFFARAKFLKREYDGAPFTFQFFMNQMSGVTTCVVKYCRMRLYVAGINLDTAFKHITDTLGEKVAQECFWDEDKN